MDSATSLVHYLDASAYRRPDHPAVEEADYSITYAALAALSDHVCARLISDGVRAHDRVGVYLHKSIDSVASIFGILKSGAAYVPADPLAPASRNAYIFNNCAVKTVIVEAVFAGKLRAEMERLGDVPPYIELSGTGGGKPLDEA